MSFISSIIFNKNEIQLKNRHLIITGKNGAGKTRFINNLVKELKNDKSIEIYTKQILREQISEVLKKGINNYNLSLNFKNQEIKTINNFRNSYISDDIYKKNLLSIQNLIHKKYRFFNKEKRAYFLKTDSSTQYKHLQIEHPDSVLENYYYYNNPHHIENFYHSLISLIDSYITNTKVVNVYPINHSKNIYYFESSRVSSNQFTLKVFQTFESIKENQQQSNVEEALEAFLIDKKMALNNLIKCREPKEHNKIDIRVETLNTNEIERLFLKIEKDIQTILENQTIELSFTKSGDQVLIIQKDKNISFSFDSLSSGFKAIFNIYANLLVRAQFQEVSPEELVGIAVIDEIDVHLHISLQKKVLPFLIKAFPKVQFIVSTHSPFVITSTNNDTVVYDISSGEFFEEDLSRYSYEAVIKGLFHVNPISAEINKSIETLKDLLNENSINYDNIRSIVKGLIQLERNGLLDKKLKNLYLQAINLLADHNQLEDLDV
ncbi:MULTISPECIES: AAA family ATPase [Acinetobacter]|uniref:ATPase AAA-type core domain-containing protein n=2 Tax=Acinetobacter TaxID=469 RepID=A0A1V2V0S5_9GAMM|nr:AAA family ATPase [Acinetobacter genomosp. 33YU]ONN55794.1 hypothetical protein AC058_04145 [Acinetobacter genomosp. 33YU]